MTLHLMRKRKPSSDNDELADDTKRLRITEKAQQILPSSFIISTMSDSTIQEKEFVENHYKEINSTLAILNRTRNQKS